MIELNYKNDYVTLSGMVTTEIINSLYEECSYKVPDAEWSEKFQSGSWDGKISLFNRKMKTFPSGLLKDVTAFFKSKNIFYTINDQRQLPVSKKQAIVDLGENSFRDYQDSAIELFHKEQRGIISIATGGGKTKAASGIISDLSVYPVLFVVPSVSLVKQTVREFSDSLKPLNDSFGIGELGGGVCNIVPQGVNVSTYHTLLKAFDKRYLETKKKIVDLEEDKVSKESLEKQLKLLTVSLANCPHASIKKVQKDIKKVQTALNNKIKQREAKAKIRELIDNCQLLIVDEAHIAAEIIEFISLRSKLAYYKCGLSATPSRADNQDKRMFGATGPIILKVTSSELIQRGILVKPYIYVIDLDFLNKSSATYQETYKNAIVLNQERNNLIRDYAIEMKAEGRPTLILVDRIEHGKILEEMIPGSLFVPGKDGSDDSPISDEELDYRRAQLDRLERNEIIMIGTQWCNTGIDAPRLSCLILATSTGADNTTIQQVGRALRRAPGKKDCVVIDFKMKEKSLRGHANSRIRTYKAEPEFRLKILKYNRDEGYSY